MSEARTRYLQQSSSNFLSHEVQAQTQNQNTRTSDTYKGSIVEQTKPSKPSHDTIFAPNPLKHEVTRASYQDSNLFNVQRQTNQTVQKAATLQERPINVRESGTFKSDVFKQQVEEDTQKRVNNTYHSTIFAQDTTNQTPKGRTKLGGESQGTETLFGNLKTTYERSSVNKAIEAPNNQNLEEPYVQVKDQKIRDFYGAAAQKYGVKDLNSIKNDGVIMAQNVDWRNADQSSPSKTTIAGLDSKDRKYQNLQSSVFGGGYVDNQEIVYDREAKNSAFGTQADWKNEGSFSRPNNGIQNLDPYRMRQKDLISQQIPLEITDYTREMPLVKPYTAPATLTDVPIAKGRKVDDEFKNWLTKQEPVNNEYDAKARNTQNLQGNYFQQNYEYPNEVQAYQPEPQTPTKFLSQQHATVAAKQQQLASSNFVTGKSTLQAYEARDAPTETLDLVISNLPPQTEGHILKRVSGSRHVISAVVDEDKVRGVCTGTGRIQIRLNNGESADQVKLNFLRLGYQVQEYSQDPRKKLLVTGSLVPQKQLDRQMFDHRVEKQNSLQSQNPDIFGTTQRYFSSGQY